MGPHGLSRARSVSGQYPSSTISTSRTVLRTTWSQGSKCLTCWCWKMTSCSGLSPQPASTSLRRTTKGKCAHLLRDLAATADLPLHSTLFPQQLLDLTHRWWSDAEGPDIDVVDVILIRHHYSFQIPGIWPAPSTTFSLTAFLGSRQPHNVPPLHSALAVHEVVAEEYRILESVNYDLVIYTPADWVSLFEARFSLRVQYLRQRSLQMTVSLLSLLARVPSGFLASVAPRRVALGALLGSSRAWFGSASCCPGLAEGKAGLVRSASLEARPLALHMPLTLASDDQGKCFYGNKTGHVKAKCRERLKDFAERKPVAATPHPSDTTTIVPLQCLLPDESHTSTFIIAMPCASKEPTCESPSEGSVMRPGAGSTALEEMEHMRLIAAITSCETHIKMDTCAGGSIFPRGFEQGAQDDPTVAPVQLATAKGDPVHNDVGKRFYFDPRRRTSTWM